jgi:hypothetical protein
MGTKLAIREISLNAQDFSTLSLATLGMACSQKYLRQITQISLLEMRVTTYEGTGNSFLENALGIS